MKEPIPNYSLYLKNQTKLMDAPDEEVLGLMTEALEWSSRMHDQQHYMDLMMTASGAAEVAEYRGLDWRTAARQHAKKMKLDSDRIDEWIAALGVPSQNTRR